MFESPISSRWLLIIFLVVGTVLLGYFLFTYFQSGTTIVFCDVGQGDGSYIRVANRYDIVVDAGPDNKITQCLGRYMPFYDRTIELAFLSHPQHDHYGGYADILDHYAITYFVATPLTNDNQSFRALIKKLHDKHVKIIHLYPPGAISAGEAHIKYFWPTVDYIEANSTRESTDVNVQSFSDFDRTAEVDLNNFSEIFEVSQGDFSILYTGDIPTDILSGLLQQAISPVTVLKVPHHGSKNGLKPDFLELADPVESVISVGVHNRYGHPSPSIIDLLKASGTRIRRTDQEGDIVYRLQ